MKQDTVLETGRLIIRTCTLSESDRQIWHELNSDEKVMHFFPYRRDRKQADEILEKIISSTKELGFGWAIVCLKDSLESIGLAGLAMTNTDVPFPPAINIGWRFVARHWGKGYATEAALALINHGFEDMDLDKIISFAVPQNSASTAIMKRLGMQHIPAMDFNLPNINNEHAHLRRNVYYELTKEAWVKQKSHRRLTGDG